MYQRINFTGYFHEHNPAFVNISKFVKWDPSQDDTTYVVIATSMQC